MKRIDAIDFTRGVVMVIMALDHTRDFMHITSPAQSPTDLSTTSPILFFTRWITHLCAPVFVFLSGTSAYLSFKRSKNTIESRKFLLSRGIWLLVLEFTLVNFALWFDIRFRVLIFEVIGAIGFGFIVLALLLKISPAITGLIGLLIIFGHGLFQFIPLPDASLPKTILQLLFTPTAIPINAQTTFVMAYPPIPWLGIMMVGFAAGKLFEMDQEKRKNIFLQIGFSALALFILVRFLNFYGDSFPWSVQKNSVFTFLSFMNVSKYPPSLLFCLVTLGIMFLILSLAENINNKIAEIMIVYGKTPLFYFLVHLYLLHLLMLVIVLLQGYRGSELNFGPFNFGRAKGSGVELWIVYLIWVAVVILLYPLCKWYGAYKAKHTVKKWLRYL